MQSDAGQYSRLTHITTVVNSQMSLHGILGNVVVAISEELVRCNSVGIYLPQPDGTFRGYVGKPEQLEGVMLDQMVIDPAVDKLAAQIIATRQSVYLPDTAESRLPDPRPVKMFSIKSLLGLPIVFEDELFGLVFVFNSGNAMHLTRPEIQAVEAYVNMAAVAIRNANLFEQKQMLLDAGKELSLCKTTREAIAICFRYLGPAIGNTNAAIHLSDGAGGFFPLALNDESEWSEVQWRITHGQMRVDFAHDAVFQHVVETKRPLVIPDVLQDPRPNADVCQEFGIRALFMLPLIAVGEVLGVIGIPTLGAARSYSEAEVEIAESLANATAATLSDLWRMERLEQMIQARTDELAQNNETLLVTVEQLQSLTIQHDMILNSVGEGIYGVDLENKITFCNRAAAEMVGVEVAQTIGRHERDVFRDCSVSLTEFFHLADHDIVQGYSEALQRVDGARFLVARSENRIQRLDHAVGRVVTFRDITEQMRMQLEIRQQAYYDTLTRLPNRLHFNEQLRVAIADACTKDRQLAVMFIDLDQFKRVNDTLGHSSGDILLAKMATLLRSCVPAGDFVARIGGDEFVVILPCDDARGRVSRIATDVIQELSKPFVIDEHQFYISPSIGVSVYPDDAEDAEALVKYADIAMYRSKSRGGRNFQFYTSVMRDVLHKRVDVERSLCGALANGEFVLHYQPQVDLCTGVILGMEALVRWDHPEDGLVPPASFIPILEEMGLIEDVGMWILRTACVQGNAWASRRRQPLRMAVNVSARQITRRDFVREVDQILRSTGFAATNLELELTESTIIQNTDSILGTMHELHDLGVRLSIDDFGTGYSSLNYLKDFPIDCLKIDRTFVSGLPDNKKHVAITSAVSTLAQNLGLRAVAEGIETERQMRFLQEHGCMVGQGYYFSRPLTPAYATTLLEAGQTFCVGRVDGEDD